MLDRRIVTRPTEQVKETLPKSTDFSYLETISVPEIILRRRRAGPLRAIQRGSNGNKPRQLGAPDAHPLHQIYVRRAARPSSSIEFATFS